MTGSRKPRPDARSLVMPTNARKIRRPPDPARPRAAPPDDVAETSPDLLKAAGELTALWARIRACEACGRARPERAYGSGYPRAPIMLVSEHPTAADLESSNAFTAEAEALTKAFDALGIPPSWLYGTNAVRCGDGPATLDEVTACSVHLLVEIEAVRPQIIVAFGSRAADALRALDGRCALQVPDEVVQGELVQIRSDVAMLVTEPLPLGITQKESKRRLWRDLRGLQGRVAPVVPVV